MQVDINADAGESFGRWQLGDDQNLFRWLSSANVACGFHAGDPKTIQETVRLAAELGVRVGAHPALPDLAGFGRRRLEITADELQAAVLYQLGALSAFVRSAGLELSHVKPHGALYHQVSQDERLATAVVAAIKLFNPELPLVVLGGPAGEMTREVAAEPGLRPVDELDREGVV